MKGTSSWRGANESVSPEGFPGVLCKQTLMHADRMCATLILPALPHFSEATSDMSQPSVGAAEAECRGNLLQGTRRAAAQQRAAGLGRCMPRQVRVGASAGPGGFTARLGVFSVCKLGRCESMTFYWKPQKSNRGNKRIPPHTSELKSGSSCNEDCPQKHFTQLL